ncbi:MAG TPA: HIRAN domain-containing protein [Opitutaceae bacterium]
MKFECEMRGAQFRPAECKEHLKTLGAGDELDVVRDAENAYDANAVALYHDGLHLGFVAKETAEEIAPLMDEGMQFRCFIHSFLSTIKPYVIIEQV